jgi:hypothetical protein
MFTLSLSSNIKDVLGYVESFQKQVPFAVALALTRTAQDLQKEIYSEEKRVFVGPTRYTLNSMYVRKATKVNLVASVGLKDRLLSGTQRGHDKTIGHQFTGGRRERKSIENYAQSAGLISANEYLVPSAGARLDSDGNMSRGQVQQLMSQLRLGIDPNQFATKSARSTRNRKKAGEVFWSRGGHLPRGIWLRVDRGVLPVMMVEADVKYAQLVDVAKLGQRVSAAKFDGHLRKAWQQALATANRR